MKISNRWLKGLSPEEIEQLRARLVANKELFDMLSRILDDKIQHVRKDRLSKDHYFLPAWAEYQAERNGEEKALQEVISIISIGE